MNVPFGDLRREIEECGGDVRAAVERVLASGWFVLGEEVRAFEAAFATYLGCEHVVGVGSGTEAIHLALQAAGVGQGDFVITVPNTAMPTVSAISAAGAIPLLVDVDPLFLTMDPERLRECVETQQKLVGSRLKAVVPVHLFGQCADMDPILAIASHFGLAVVEDAAQAHGARYRGRLAGTMGDFGAFSFYPSKNLGCYGDGGAVVARTAEGARLLRMLRNYGQSRRYHHEIKGVNSRLDELQAAILRAKLPYLDPWLRRREQIAQMYDRMLDGDVVRKPSVAGYGRHSWHLYVVSHDNRKGLRSLLERRGVQTSIHYPVPIHLQPAYQDLRPSPGSLAVAEKAQSEILSLPLFPQLSDAEIEYVSACVNSARQA